ncbi:ABC transporter [Halobiforma lacisalsi AJ5]|uniref:ABC transporter n=1 Tax=Natronobacterium lacisalsi AJ5 TaxID=358396 RepID=M0LW77_NATLA|nr:ABC transporter [Halobiforma lacisalsi AJ5]EMA37408.1 ABC transporter [Halobiforma lacisalsi AJ5]
MTWSTIAKKDFRDAVQSRALWALVAVFVLASVLSTYAYVEAPELLGSPGGATLGGLIFFTIGLVGLFVPLAAIVVCYKSLAGERELGSIKLLLSLPTTRLDVFVGKVVGPVPKPSRVCLW